MKNCKLYVILDKESAGKRDIIKIALEMLRGGADIVQLRDKISPDAALIEEAKAIRHLAKRYKKKFIMNDRVDIAAAVNADGVHLGQADMPIKHARKILPQKLIGISTHNLKQAEEAEKSGADYIGIGPIFRTSTKAGSRPIGLRVLKKIKQKVSIPFFAIGGIDVTNIKSMRRFDVYGIAVISAIMKSKDVYHSTSAIKRELETKDC